MEQLKKRLMQKIQFPQTEIEKNGIEAMRVLLKMLSGLKKNLIERQFLFLLLIFLLNTHQENQKGSLPKLKSRLTHIHSDLKNQLP